MVTWIKDLPKNKKGFFLHHDEGYGDPPEQWKFSPLDGHFLINQISYMSSSGHYTHPVAIADTEEEAFDKAYALARKRLGRSGGIDKTSRVAEKDRLVEKITQNS